MATTARNPDLVSDQKMANSSGFFGTLGNLADNVLGVGSAIAGFADKPGVVEPTGSLIYVDKPVPTKSLRFRENDMVPSQTELCGVQPYTGDIQSLLMQPQRINIISWQATSGDLLKTFYVTPDQAAILTSTYQFPGSDVNYHQFRTTTLQKYCRLYHYWRGSLVFTFEPVYHFAAQGQLAIAFWPNSQAVTSNPTFEEIRATHHVVLDLAQPIDVDPDAQDTGVKRVKLEIPYLCKDPLTPLTETSHSPDGLVKVGETYEDCNGVVTVHVVNSLVIGNDTFPQSIDINVYLEAGKDFEFKVPRMTLYGDWRRSPHASSTTVLEGDERLGPDDTTTKEDPTPPVQAQEQVPEPAGAATAAQVEPEDIQSTSSTAYVIKKNISLAFTKGAYEWIDRVEVPKDYFDSALPPSGISKFTEFVRFDSVECELRVSATPVHMGQILLVWIPETQTGQPLSGPQLSNLPHDIIDVRTRTHATVRAGWCYRKATVRVSEVISSFNVYIWNKLAGSGTELKCTLIVRMNGLKHLGRTPPPRSGFASLFHRIRQNTQEESYRQARALLEDVEVYEDPDGEAFCIPEYPLEGCAGEDIANQDPLVKTPLSESLVVQPNCVTALRSSHLVGNHMDAYSLMRRELPVGTQKLNATQHKDFPGNGQNTTKVAWDDKVNFVDPVVLSTWRFPSCFLTEYHHIILDDWLYYSGGSTLTMLTPASKRDASVLYISYLPTELNSAFALNHGKDVHDNYTKYSGNDVEIFEGYTCSIVPRDEPFVRVQIPYLSRYPLGHTLDRELSKSENPGEVRQIWSVNYPMAYQTGEAAVTAAEAKWKSLIEIPFLHQNLFRSTDEDYLLYLRACGYMYCSKAETTSTWFYSTSKGMKRVPDIFQVEFSHFPHFKVAIDVERKILIPAEDFYRQEQAVFQQKGHHLLEEYVEKRLHRFVLVEVPLYREGQLPLQARERIDVTGKFMSKQEMLEFVKHQNYSSIALQQILSRMDSTSKIPLTTEWIRERLLLCGDVEENPGPCLSCCCCAPRDGEYEEIGGSVQMDFFRPKRQLPGVFRKIMQWFDLTQARAEERRNRQERRNRLFILELQQWIREFELHDDEWQRNFLWMREHVVRELREQGHSVPGEPDTQEQRLLLSGDVETNPGPDPCVHQGYHSLSRSLFQSLCKQLQSQYNFNRNCSKKAQLSVQARKGFMEIGGLTYLYGTDIPVTPSFLRGARGIMGKTMLELQDVAPFLNETKLEADDDEGTVEEVSDPTASKSWFGAILSCLFTWITSVPEALVTVFQGGAQKLNEVITNFLEAFCSEKIRAAGVNFLSFTAAFASFFKHFLSIAVFIGNLIYYFSGKISFSFALLSIATSATSDVLVLAKKLITEELFAKNQTNDKGFFVEAKLEGFDTQMQEWVSVFGSGMFGLLGTALGCGAWLADRQTFVRSCVGAVVGSTVRDFLGWLKDVIKRVIDWFFAGPEETTAEQWVMDHLGEIDDLIREWRVRQHSNAFSPENVHANLGCVHTQLAEESGFTSSGETTKSFLLRCANKCDELKPRLTQMKSQYVDLREWVREVDRTLHAYLHSMSVAGTRPEPVGIIFTGSPGCGKSFMQSVLLPTFVLQKVGIAKAGEIQNCVYSMPMDKNARFFDNYHGHPWFVCDDLGADAEGEDFQIFMNFISTCSAQVNMADLKDKGTMFVSEFVCASTNATTLTSKAIQHPEAFQRRFPFAYSMSLRTKFVKEPVKLGRSTLDMNAFIKNFDAAKDLKAKMQVINDAFLFKVWDKTGGVHAEVTFETIVDEISRSYILKKDTRKLITKVMDVQVESKLEGVSDDEDDVEKKMTPETRKELVKILQERVKMKEKLEQSVDEVDAEPLKESESQESFHTCTEEFEVGEVLYSKEVSDFCEKEPDLQYVFKLPLDRLPDRQYPFPQNRSLAWYGFQLVAAQCLDPAQQQNGTSAETFIFVRDACNSFGCIADLTVTRRELRIHFPGQKNWAFPGKILLNEIQNATASEFVKASVLFKAFLFYFGVSFDLSRRFSTVWKCANPRIVSPNERVDSSVVSTQIEKIYSFVKDKFDDESEKNPDMTRWRNRAAGVVGVYSHVRDMVTSRMKVFRASPLYIFFSCVISCVPVAAAVVTVIRVLFFVVDRVFSWIISYFSLDEDEEVLVLEGYSKANPRLRKSKARKPQAKFKLEGWEMDEMHKAGEVSNKVQFGVHPWGKFARRNVVPVECAGHHRGYAFFLDQNSFVINWHTVEICQEKGQPMNFRVPCPAAEGRYLKSFSITGINARKISPDLVFAKLAYPLQGIKNVWDHVFDATLPIREGEIGFADYDVKCGEKKLRGVSGGTGLQCRVLALEEQDDILCGFCDTQTFELTENRTVVHQPDRLGFLGSPRTFRAPVFQSAVRTRQGDCGRPYVSGYQDGERIYGIHFTQPATGKLGCIPIPVQDCRRAGNLIDSQTEGLTVHHDVPFTETFDVKPVPLEGVDPSAGVLGKVAAKYPVCKRRKVTHAANPLNPKGEGYDPEGIETFVDWESDGIRLSNMRVPGTVMKHHIDGYQYSILWRHGTIPYKFKYTEPWKMAINISSAKVKTFIGEAGLFDDGGVAPSVKSKEELELRAFKYKVPPNTEPQRVEILLWCARGLRSQFSTALRGVPDYPYGLTIEQVINGVPEIGLERMKLDTSPGYWSKFVHTKAQCFEVNEDPGPRPKETTPMPDVEYWPTGGGDIIYQKLQHHPWTGNDLRQTVHIEWKHIREGCLMFHNPTITCLKDELRPWDEEKGRPKKTRTFENMPVNQIIDQKRFFAEFLSRLSRHAGFQTHFAISIDVVGCADIIRRGFHCFDDMVFWDADVSAFDASMPIEFFSIFEWLVNEWYGDLGEWHECARAIIIRNLVYTRCVAGDVTFVKNQGVPSGSYCTIGLNSIFSCVMLMTAFYWMWNAEKCSEPDLSDFEENVVFLVCGDDILVGTTREVCEWFNRATYAGVMAKYGIKVTDASKSEDKIKTWDEFEDVTFLKRHFIYDEAYQVTRAPLPKEVIHREVNWIRKKWRTNGQVLYPVLDQAMAEMGMWGREAFDEFRDKLFKFAQDNPIYSAWKPKWVTYEKFIYHLKEHQDWYYWNSLGSTWYKDAAVTPCVRPLPRMASGVFQTFEDWY